MNREIMKLVEQCGFPFSMLDVHGSKFEAFYRAAYNKAIKAAWEAADESYATGKVLDAIYALEMK
jgi:hypothetical protein